jgi:hypothetical protein
MHLEMMFSAKRDKISFRVFVEDAFVGFMVDVDYLATTEFASLPVPVFSMVSLLLPFIGL